MAGTCGRWPSSRCGVTAGRSLPSACPLLGTMARCLPASRAREATARDGIRIAAPSVVPVRFPARGNLSCTVVAVLRICLLGPFRVERDGRVIRSHEWARPKDRALLKLLALDRGHLVPQDRLCDALWPHLAPASAANSLHASVSRLRKLLGPAPLIRRERAGYTLAATASVWIDVEEFRQALGQAREWRCQGAWAPAAQAYRTAAALYRGELLD